MSSIMSKQLGEFLQEQQEPFILEVYLLERGYSKRKLSAEYNVGAILKRSVSSGLKRNRTFIPNCSRLVRGLFSKLLNSVGDNNNTHKTNNATDGKREKKSFSISSRSSKETADDDIYSSASSATIFNSCSESDAEDAYYYSSRKDSTLETADYYKSSEIEVGGDEMLRWNNIKLSPVSVLDTESSHASPFLHKSMYLFRSFYMKYHIFLCSCLNSNFYLFFFGTWAENDDSRRRKFQYSALINAYNKTEKLYYYWRSDASSSSSQYSRNKKTLKQTEKLLVDCVREVVERVKRDSGPDLRSPQILGSDQIWELICQDLSLWSKEPINETNSSRLVHSQVVVSAPEWSSKFEQDKEDVGMQIADAILDDIIRTEIIKEMISLQ
ncbi:OLC1v1017025C1 [Oldenlandia corymbosa var. corymbosa]|uniref:OLC1v1017025C1 n=1 Tax=Oldenlandia corymbosa var. corymbosa TaxID=529605 RepID=A0AAV1E8L7_OLDCO|nr:OLC1v1017025C1 [Oldenlandia corymbosa var. corymbosa]